MSERGGDVFAFGEFAGDEPDAQRRHSRRESEARQLDIGPREIDRLLASGAFVVRYGMLIHRRGFSRGCRRSEEHTSELQSLMRISYAVFCLKKKKTCHSKYNK